MGKFSCSYKLAIGYAQANDASRSWIFLHRCVEALSRTTGETFNSIFARLETHFQFTRKSPKHWPTAKIIGEAANLIKTERDIFLSKLNAEIEIRKSEKQQGCRECKNQDFLDICHQQNNHKIPKLGFWGWRNTAEQK